MEDIFLENLTVNYEKNTRNVYIKDERGKIFFIVSFITLDEKETWENKKYLIKVIELRDDQTPFDLVREFFSKSEKKLAAETFKNMIRDYQVLVRGPVEDDVDPRVIFNETVNYRKVDPDRCENCCFCVFHDYEDPDKKERVVKCLCSCKKNLRTNEYTEELFNKYSSKREITDLGDMVEIEPDHICNNYSKVRD